MRQNKYCVAVTGGIGSGKSEVMKIIHMLGYPVFSADAVAHEVFDDPFVLEKTAQEFPECVVGHRIDRQKLADQVFCDELKRKKLEAMTHPIIMQRLFREMEQAGSDVVFAEVPLLFEGGYEKDFDAVIVVMRNLQKRIRSAAERDKVSEEKIILRIKNQFDYEKKNVSGHTVIYNDKDLASLTDQVKQVVHEIVRKAKS